MAVRRSVVDLVAAHRMRATFDVGGLMGYDPDLDLPDPSWPR